MKIYNIWNFFIVYGKWFHDVTRVRLGRVAPLGRPISVYKSDVECHFVSVNGQMALKVKVNASHFQYQTARIPRCIFGANLVILAQIHQKLLRGQAEILRILSQNGQNDLEGQGQWPPLSIPAESITECMFGANLVILAQIHDELSHRQAKFPRILSQNGQNDLEGQGQWPPFSIPAESILWFMFGANLVIPAKICDELSCRQGKVYGQTDGRMDGRTDAGNNNTPSAWKAKG